MFNNIVFFFFEIRAYCPSSLPSFRQTPLHTPENDATCRTRLATSVYGSICRDYPHHTRSSENPVRAIRNTPLPNPVRGLLDRNWESDTVSEKKCTDIYLRRSENASPPLSDIRAAPFLVTGFRCGILDAMKLCRLSGVRS